MLCDTGGPGNNAIEGTGLGTGGVGCISLADGASPSSDAVGKQDRIAHVFCRLVTATSVRKGPTLRGSIPSAMREAALDPSMTPVWPIIMQCKRTCTHPIADRFSDNCACCCNFSCLRSCSLKSDV